MLMPDPYQSEHDGYLSAYLRTGNAKVIGAGREVLGRRKNGEIFPLELAVNHITVGDRDLFTGVIRDITEQKAAAERLHNLNEDLSNRLNELDAMNRINNIINEMNSFFQAAEDVYELNGILGKFISQLFERESGAFLVMHMDSHMEKAAAWGEKDLGAEMGASDCWAMRRGEVHAIDSAADPLVCAHLRDQGIFSSVCVPVIAREGAVGLLTLENRECPDEDAARHASRLQRNRAALTSVAERLGIAISDIKLRQRLLTESSRDPITNLYNRRHFDEAISIELRRSLRTQAPTTLIIADIDHFKLFNDNFGHEAGDVVLRAIGKVFMSLSGAEDVICRIGGEEFALILPNCDYEDAILKATELAGKVSQTTLTHQQVTMPPVTISCGVATIPDHSDNVADWVELADSALYRAKDAGRNRVVGQIPSIDLDEPE